jgi:orotidine-5'-phosphate decarboxylase
VSSPRERLALRATALGSRLCLGIDPHPDRLPESLPRDARGIELFARGLIESAVEHAIAVKINVAFFEAWGADGWAALERVRRDVPAGVVCVLDAKRGDIGSTAERYAEALFGRLNADAVTVSPYLGADAVEPFLAYPDRLLYVLARTSNPSAPTFQSLAIDGVPLHERVARWVASTWTDGRVGLVVGATDPNDLDRLRSVVPGPAFLVPGVGAQGGDLAAAVRACDGAWGPGLVAVSRAIAEASAGPDWRSAAADAAGALRARMHELVLDSPPSAADAARVGGS